MKKNELAVKAGMNYEEVREIFSVDTLSTMLMMSVIGGAESCNAKKCILNESACNPGCTVNNCDCTPEPTTTPTPTPAP